MALLGLPEDITDGIDMTGVEIHAYLTGPPLGISVVAPIRPYATTDLQVFEGWIYGPISDPAATVKEKRSVGYSYTFGFTALLHEVMAEHYEGEGFVLASARPQPSSGFSLFPMIKDHDLRRERDEALRNRTIQQVFVSYGTGEANSETLGRFGFQNGHHSLERFGGPLFPRVCYKIVCDEPLAEHYEIIRSVLMLHQDAEATARMRSR
jgi:hypothetical protein